MLVKFRRFVAIVLVLNLLLGRGVGYVKAEEFVITDNGSGSSSEVNITQESQTTVTQSNASETSNSVDTNTNTGGNSVSENTNGDASITTGDAASQVVVENSGNTSTVNIGCCPTPSEVTISGNGSDSTNAINITSSSQTTITSNQTATITNYISGTASTGSNSANDNSGGNVTITTGNITVSAKIINAPVNTSSVSVKSGNPGLIAKISENGTDSNNDISVSFFNDTEVYTQFAADIENYLLWDLNSGGNQADGNSGGNVTIKTGDIDLEVFINNFINLGNVEVDCCEDIFDPGDKDDEPDRGGLPPSVEKDKEKDNNTSPPGSILPSAAATEAGGPGIIGLSDTSSEGAQALFFFLALAMISLGGKIVVDELFPQKNFASLKKRVK
ncbi:MAG: hypothetical protein UT24_C0008G0037 [Candidatus Woesebacteria bacterium GW2011_GWB1_39_12]|uniref:Uncharacterized protein n=2 Tax=Candidatus Woeseibacteriota TaxID=1752722 RepID=A0A0G0LZU2_9BACT|nr:MAG: hypothetical protein UT23_C0012G0063 [Candidatus Woesebacteria bacterium GW2011_GWA1_39_12]KKR00909.1 MAG: hypothetical protein UT24_C0008G0037 [Candidatus Woesebacteria bacterium GW2011_GWB1_39_12]